MKAKTVENIIEEVKNYSDAEYIICRTNNRERFTLHLEKCHYKVSVDDECLKIQDGDSLYYIDTNSIVIMEI